MKQKTFTLKTNLFTKLLLSLALILAAPTAWADDIVIYDEGNIADGWNNGAGNSSYNYTIGTNELTALSGSTYSRLQSANNFTFSNKRIIIKAKRLNDNESYVILYSGYSAITAVKFGYNSSTAGGGNEIYSADEYVELISIPFSVSSNKLDLRAKNVKICSARIVDEGELLLDEDNPTALMKGSKTETVRFKYKAQKGWNTICVPFQLKSGSSYEHLTTIFGSDWKAYKISAYSDGTLTFTNAVPNSYSSISANVPTLVYAPNATTSASGVELTSNVSITYANSESNRRATAGNATFQGIYTTKTYTDGDNWYGVTSSGKVMKAGTGASVKGYRAYLTGVSAPSTGVKMIILEDDGGETDLGFVKMVDENAKDVYTLTGQKVQKGRKGIYIVNGKKVVIK